MRGVPIRPSPGRMLPIFPLRGKDPPEITRASKLARRAYFLALEQWTQQRTFLGSILVTSTS